MNEEDKKELQYDSEIFIRNLEKSRNALVGIFKEIFDTAFRDGYKQCLYDNNIPKKKDENEKKITIGFLKER